MNSVSRSFNPTAKSNCFALLFLMFTSAPTLSAQISGSLTNFSGMYSVTAFDQSSKIPLRAFNAITENHLARLKTGDILTGSGEFSGPIFVMTNIDFVGLRSLLGVWVSGDILLNITSFTNVKVQIKGTAKKVSMAFKYSLSPGELNNWRIFFSNDKEVLLGKLQIEKNTAALQLIDADNGETSKVIELKKIQGYH